MIQTAMSAINESLGTNLSLFKEGRTEWRDAQDIFEDIAASWHKMNGVERGSTIT